MACLNPNHLLYEKHSANKLQSQLIDINTKNQKICRVIVSWKENYIHYLSIPKKIINHYPRAL